MTDWAQRTVYPIELKLHSVPLLSATGPKDIIQHLRQAHSWFSSHPHFAPSRIESLCVHLHAFPGV